MRTLLLALLVSLAACKASSASDSFGGDPCNPPHTILVKRLIPPAKNPYPPTDALGAKRVRVAEAAIRAFYTTRLDETALRTRMKRPHAAELDDLTKGPDAFQFEDKRSECLGDVECWSKDYAFLRRIQGLSSASPPWIVKRTLWAHAAPWSLARVGERDLPPAQRHYGDDFRIQEGQKHDYQGTSAPEVFLFSVPKLRDDEYIVDAVVEMEGKEGYFHLIHVLRDDKNGEPALHYIEMVPIQDITRPSCYH